MGAAQNIFSLLAIGLTILQDSGHSQELACSSTHESNVYSFTVNASSPVGTINLMYVQHDGARLIPLSTTVLHNSLNMQQNAERQDDFRAYPCSSIAAKQTLCETTYKMTPEQTTISGGRTAFDRGHLTPANPHRFSANAISNTFYCVNIAPQDPFTNQNPWFTVEDASHQYFATKSGYVMTGLCDANNRYSPTLDGYKIPTCFWKLVCYKDAAGETQVVGFIGNNTLLHNDDSAGKAKRTVDTTTPLGQQTILSSMTRDSFIMDAWDGAETYLRKNRNAANLPTATNCKAARTISTAVKNEWSSLMREAVLQHEFTEEVDLQAIKEFWKNEN